MSVVMTFILRLPKLPLSFIKVEWSLHSFFWFLKEITRQNVLLQLMQTKLLLLGYFFIMMPLDLWDFYLFGRNTDRLLSLLPYLCVWDTCRCWDCVSSIINILGRLCVFFSCYWLCNITDLLKHPNDKLTYHRQILLVEPLMPFAQHASILYY